MPVEFIGKEIEVALSDDPVRLPQSFKLGGKDYGVTEVISTWQDHAYSGLPQPRRGWQGGSQRQFYRLHTDQGETFEIYVETQAGRRGAAHKARWYAARRLSAGALTEGAAKEEATQRREEILGG